MLGHLAEWKTIKGRKDLDEPRKRYMERSGSIIISIVLLMSDAVSCSTVERDLNKLLELHITVFYIPLLIHCEESEENDMNEVGSE